MYINISYSVVINNSHFFNSTKFTENIFQICFSGSQTQTKYTQNIGHFRLILLKHMLTFKSFFFFKKANITLVPWNSLSLLQNNYFSKHIFQKKKNLLSARRRRATTITGATTTATRRNTTQCQLNPVKKSFNPLPSSWSSVTRTRTRITFNTTIRRVTTRRTRTTDGTTIEFSYGWSASWTTTTLHFLTIDRFDIILSSVNFFGSSFM